MSLNFLVNFHKTVVWAKEGEEKRELTTKEVCFRRLLPITVPQRTATGAPHRI